MTAVSYFLFEGTPASEGKQPGQILRDLLRHSINMLLIARQPISAHQICTFINSVWPIHDRKLGLENTAFNETVRLLTEHHAQLCQAYEDSGGIKLTRTGPMETNADEYFNALDKSIPERSLGRQFDEFFSKEYMSLDKERRGTTDLAFSGLLFTALNDPDFAALCKDKDIDVAAMSFEQKMHEELDHEALYRYLQRKLEAA